MIALKQITLATFFGLEVHLDFSLLYLICFCPIDLKHCLTLEGLGFRQVPLIGKQGGPAATGFNWRLRNHAQFNLAH